MHTETLTTKQYLGDKNLQKLSLFCFLVDKSNKVDK